MTFSLRITFSTILFLALSLSINAQLENHTWFFGGGTDNTQPGIRFDFTTNQPMRYNEVRHPLGLQENNIIVSNPSNGDVIFYSDGQIVVDGTHNPMPNGSDLNGSSSAMYGTAIVFDPSGCDRYFLISVQSETDPANRKIFYSVVDLNLPGNGTIPEPLGDIDPALKNIDFTPSGVNCTEGIFAISKFGVNKDSWLFFGDRNDNVLYQYQVTTSGISYFDQYDLRTLLPTLPQEDVFSVKMDYFPLADGRGRFIIAPGRDVDRATYPIGSFIFNSETGVIEQNTYQLIEEDTYWTYGTTFSPDGSKLYISDYVGKTLKQYDYNTNTLLQLARSSHSGRTGGIETGPDGKVYWANVFVYQGQTGPINTLSIVNNPNAAGNLADLELNRWNINANINPRLIGALPTLGTFPIPPVADVISAANCDLDNGSAIINPGESIQPVLYAWDNGETTALAETLSTGIHYVTITDGLGCAKVLEVFIDSEGAQLQPIINGNNILCASGTESTSLMVEDTYEIYMWSNGESTQSITVDSPGIYSVTVTEDGCEGEASIEVFEEIISVQISGDTVICGPANSSTTLTVEANYDNYIWSNGETTSSIIVNEPGIYSLIVSLNGCEAESSVEIFEENINAQIIGDPSICEMGNTTTTLMAEPGYDNYIWSNGETSQSIIVNTPGTYSLLISSNGCEAETSIEVSEESIETQILGDPTICAMGNTTTTLMVEDGFDSYTWSNGELSSSIIADAPGNYTVLVSIDGCEAEASIEIIEEFVEPQILGDATICTTGNTTTTLIADGSFDNYMWSNGVATSSIVVDTPGVYTLWVTADGCEGESSIEILEETIDVEILGDSILCQNNNNPNLLELNSSYEEYLWSTLSTNNAIEINQEGLYSVTVTSSGGCTAEDEISISTVEGPQIINLPSVIEVNCGESLSLNPSVISNEPYSIQWLPSEGLSCEACLQPTIIDPLLTQSLQLVISDDQGCQEVSSVQINITGDNRIYYPNIFTPNNDGDNDRFTLYGNSDLTNIKSLKIYSRWGELVFHRENFAPNDESFGWSGVFNGKELPPAVFTWTAEVEYCYSNIQFLKGSVLLAK